MAHFSHQSNIKDKLSDSVFDASLLTSFKPLSPFSFLLFLACIRQSDRKAHLFPPLELAENSNHMNPGKYTKTLTPVQNRI